MFLCDRSLHIELVSQVSGGSLTMGNSPLFFQKNFISNEHGYIGPPMGTLVYWGSSTVVKLSGSVNKPKWRERLIEFLLK